VLLQAVVCAQAIPTQKGMEEDFRKQESPLEIKLSTSTPTLYAGSCLMMEMVLTNEGTEELKIDESDLWKLFMYSYAAQDGSGKGGGQGSTCYGCSDETLSLNPGMTYTSSHCFDLDNEFFRNAGEYGITTIIRFELAGKSGNSAASNSIRFEIY
jgi:hypothetical protein